MKIKLFIIILFLLIGNQAVAEGYKQAVIYTDLRSKALFVTNEQLSINSPTLSILMETGYVEAVASLVAVADGASSIYFSNGGGIIGAGEYQEVHDEALKMIDMASENINKFKPTNIFPLPKNGFTRFYVVTNSGSYTAEIAEEELGSGKHVLSPVFFQGHKLISYIRTVEEHRNASPDR